jgi:arylsulfatase A-like enzyme
MTNTVIIDMGHKMMHLLMLFTCSIAMFFSCDTHKPKRPNMIFILIDDLGYGDLGCYNPVVTASPNIDRIASEGIIFTDFHSNGPVCTPTRVSILTGRYQHRFGARFEGALGYHDGLPVNTFTIADAMHHAGYATAIYGKWHIGVESPYLPPSYGFDDFIGLATGDGDHHTHIARAGHVDWWHNNEIRMEEGYSTDLINEHSIDFIKKNRDGPFFLYISHLAIHFPWQGPNDPPHRQEGFDYGKDKFGIIQDSSNVRPHVLSMLQRVDTGIGTILEALQDLDLHQNTILVISSDNGGYRHYSNKFFNISSNGPFKGQKGQMHEGGHRVPLIVYWPQEVAPGQESNALAMSMDLMPTFAEWAHYQIPDSVRLDGISLASHIENRSPLPQRTLFWKKRNVSAVRQANWKLCLIEGSAELYNLENDLSEQHDLYAQMPEKVQELTREYTSWLETVAPSGSGGTIATNQ